MEPLMTRRRHRMWAKTTKAAWQRIHRKAPGAVVGGTAVHFPSDVDLHRAQTHIQFVGTPGSICPCWIARTTESSRLVSV